MPRKLLPTRSKRLKAIEEYKEYLDHFCVEFGIKVSDRPKFQILDHSGDAYYLDDVRTISISYEHHLGRLGVMTHEFAHFLASLDNPEHNHDLWFYDWLIACIDTVYTNISDYPWDKEYVSLRALAIKDKYLFDK